MASSRTQLRRLLPLSPEANVVRTYYLTQTFLCLLPPLVCPFLFLVCPFLFLLFQLLTGSSQGLSVLNSAPSALAALTASFPDLLLGPDYQGRTKGEDQGATFGDASLDGGVMGGRDGVGIEAGRVVDEGQDPSLESLGRVGGGESTEHGSSEPSSAGQVSRGDSEYDSSARGVGDAGGVSGGEGPSELLRRAARLSPVLHVLVHEWGLRREADVARILLAHPGLLGLPLSVADQWRRALKQVSSGG